MSDQPKPVRFQYVRAPGYRVIPANSVWLSPSTNGMIAIDLLVEQLASPGDRISSFDGEKWLPEEPVNVSDEVFAVREAQIGLLVNPATARMMAYLLLAKADELEPLISSDEKSEE